MVLIWDHIFSPSVNALLRCSIKRSTLITSSFPWGPAADGLVGQKMLCKFLIASTYESNSNSNTAAVAVTQRQWHQKIFQCVVDCRAMMMTGGLGFPAIYTSVNSPRTSVGWTNYSWAIDRIKIALRQNIQSINHVDMFPYIVIRARNEKLAWHLLSYQPVCSGASRETTGN